MVALALSGLLFSAVAPSPARSKGPSATAARTASSGARHQGAPPARPGVVADPQLLVKEGGMAADGGSSMPATATSHYLHTTDATAVARLGCAQSRSLRGRRGSAIAVLAFGMPMKVHGVFGASLFGGGFHSTGRIGGAARIYAGAYVRCAAGASAPRLRVALGTSNYGSHVTYGHGMAWAEMVNAANDWGRAHGLSARVDFAGAADIELGWNTPRQSRVWVRGYDAKARWPYYDYGDAAACPPRGGCLGGWTQEDVWYVAWGARTAWPLPEIYTPSGSMAAEWFHLSQYSVRRHGAPMRFAGALSQRAACGQVSDSCAGMNNSARHAWTQLHRLLNSDRRTAQPLPWSTDIRWQSHAP